MPKLPRVIQRIFGENADQDGKIAQFGSVVEKAPLRTGDIKTIQQLDAWLKGWVGATISDRRFPTSEETTGINKVITQQLAYIFQQGIPEWHIDEVYYKNSCCKANDKIFFSLADDNVGHPTSESDWWKVVKDQSKANTDMDNLTETGKNEITSYAFPSSRYDELELMPSGQNYTAPTDGWYCISKLIGSVSAVKYIDLYNTSNGIISTLPLTGGGTGNALRGFLPVMKGEIVKVSYNINGNTEYFRFYYAEGVK